MKKWTSKFLIAFFITFLPFFMIFIFGPAEIFFANAVEFEFVYGDFGGYLAVLAVGAAAGLSLVITALPQKVYKIALAIVFGIALAGYLQVMFFNKQLDLLGLNPDGYQVENSAAIINAVLWVIIMGLVVTVVCLQKSWRQILAYGSAFLLCIQLTALVTLYLTAGEEAYEYPKGEWHLSGEKQYTVSADQNVIVVILDYYSNLDLIEVEKSYPGMTDFLHDFTYYSNTDCNYYGTFPSIAHMLTGVSVDPSLKVNEWCRQAWTDEESKAFYDQLKQNGYQVNVYTPDVHYLLGTNSAELLKDSISNVSNEHRLVDVHYKLLFKTMGKMAAYRMMPEVLKPYFYTSGSEYTEIIQYLEDNIEHCNYDFYQQLLSQGITADDDANYFIFQHLEGPHNLRTGADGHFKEVATLEETIKGCMVILEEYLNQLKALGVYEDASIIITSDHGDMRDSQVILYMKEPGESHAQMQVTNAPITLKELRPTVAKLAGLEYARFGQTFYDFSEDELRERTVWVRNTDMAYPIIDNYAENRIGYANVYQGFTYIGGIDELLETVDDGPDETVAMVDSFF